MKDNKEGIFEKLVDLKVERSKLNREQSTLMLDKGLLVYFAFLVIAILGLIKDMINITQFLILIVLAFSVLFVTSLPYIRMMLTEKKMIDDLISDLEARLKK